MNFGLKYLKQLKKCKFKTVNLTSTSNVNCYFSEILHEDKVFQQHQLAALVASKVYYHLGSFEDSLTYALGAGDLFDVNSRTEYVETIIGKIKTTFF